MIPTCRACIFIGLCMLIARTVAADVGNIGAWGDNGDGTYFNPVLPCDYSDLDAIKVGDDFFAISSTMQFSPGMVILQSKDLVNWTIAGHAVSDLTQAGPELNWNRMDCYGRGAWAGAIRYHAGKFWVYFGTPDEGYFMTTAATVAGPWEPLHPVLKSKGWDDCCPFWDDDGKEYLVGTNFADAYKIHLFQLTPDGRDLVNGSDRIIHQSKGSEANKLYKINGFYYHYYSGGRREGRVVMMERSKSLEGPWENRQLNHVNAKIDKEPNQGGLIETKPGEWWFLTHQGTGSWEGRALCLLPVQWIDGWPVIGKPGDDGIGNMVWSAKKPIAGLPTTMPATSDEFDKPQLGEQWEWNYQPRADKWSLTERPGSLRLHAFRPLKVDDFFKAGNTITQRSWRAANCVASAKLDVSNMADGQIAGMVHFAKAYCMIGIRQIKGVRAIFWTENGKPTPGPAVPSNSVWFRSTWGQDGISQFSYSFDGSQFIPLGTTYGLAWGYYRGDRIGICSYNNDAEAGYIDVDWFHLAFDGPVSPGASH